MSVFSEKAPKSDKVSYAFKIYRRYARVSMYLIRFFDFQKESINVNAQVRHELIPIRHLLNDLVLDGESATPDAIDLYDIKESFSDIPDEPFSLKTFTKNNWWWLII